MNIMHGLYSVPLNVISGHSTFNCVFCNNAFLLKLL